MIHADFAENHAPDVIAYFTKPDGGLLNAGDRLVNKPYADFLRRLAAQGPAALYAGSTAAKIVARTHAGPLAGSMTMADLANYKPIKREPVCGPYRIYHALRAAAAVERRRADRADEILEHTDIAARGPNDPQAWYLFAEASRLMYADRDRYVGDPAFVKVPVAGLIDPGLCRASARALIGADRRAAAGRRQPRAGACSPAPTQTLEPTGTSHFIVRDADGNVVSMTTTVESIFGTGRMVDGFFLNNQLTDFSFSPVDAQGRPVANAVAPGKRPRSSMVPVDPADQRRPVRRRDRLGRRQCDPRLCRQVAGRGDRLERADGRGAGRAEPRRARAQLPGRSDQILARGARRPAPARHRPEARPGRGFGRAPAC